MEETKKFIDTEVETGLRVYSRSYCLELFPAKWQQYATVVPWFLVQGSFEKVLKHFYSTGVYAATILGTHNLGMADNAFSIRGISIDLPVTCVYGPPFSFQAGPNYVRLFRPMDAQEQFKKACELLKFDWKEVEQHLIGLLDKLYHEGLILVGVDEANAAAFMAAFSDGEEMADLKVRFRI